MSKNPSDNTFIQERHSSYNPITKEQLQELIVQNTDFGRITQCEKIVRGYDNEVYDVETQDGTNLIVRIARYGDSSFVSEAWAMDQCRQHNVPVPAVYFVGDITIADQQLQAMITQKSQGVALSKLFNQLDEEQIQIALYNAGQTLKAMHAIPVGGFYKRYEDGTWDFANWDSASISTLTDRMNEKDLILEAGLSGGEFDFLITQFKNYLDRYHYDQAVLCHADYLPEHIFIDSETFEVRDIIDFGEFQGGPYILDLAYFHFECPEIDMTPMISGYFDNQTIADSFWGELYGYQIGLQLGYLAHYVVIGDHTSILPTKQALQKTIAYFKSS